MFRTLLLLSASCCLGQLQDNNSETAQPEILAEYQRASQVAAQNAEANVRLALWCERQGMTAERNKHLAKALLADPEQSGARGMLRQVWEDGRWTSPSKVVKQATADDASARLLDEYAQKRAQARMEVPDQLELAQWCEDQGLERQWRAHLITVLKLDPSRETTWKRLGFKKYQGQWMSDDQIEASKQDAKAQQEANKKWGPLLSQWKKELSSPRTRQQAEQAFATVDDPLAVPAIVALLGKNEAEQRLAAQLLGQIDDPAAAQALARLALQGASADVRRIATETLRNCDVREFAGPLVAHLREPLKYQAAPPQGPGTTGQIQVESERFRHVWRYQVNAPPTQLADRNFVNDVTARLLDQEALFISDQQRILQAQNAAAMNVGQQLAANPSDAVKVLSEAASLNLGSIQLSPTTVGPGVSVGQVPPFLGPTAAARLRINQLIRQQAQTENAQRAQQATLDAQTRMQQDIQFLESINAGINEANQLVKSVLEPVSGISFGDEIKPWRSWWLNQVGLEDRTRYDQPKPVLFQTQAFGNYVDPPSVVTTSCFAAGTLVHTSKGTLPIESLRPGDLVLSQNVQKGSLSYQPITAVHANPPSLIHEVKIGGEILRASQFHRFWKAGKGWVMARDLKPGDLVRALDGLEQVEQVDIRHVEPVFNLDVDTNHSFFVGVQGALVHDNTLPDRRITPFDRVAQSAQEAVIASQ